MTVLALHGFLGSGRDYEPLISELSHAHYSAEWLCPNFFRSGSCFSLNSFSDLRQQLNCELDHLSGPKVLMGYSLGGRIALDLFLSNPRAWQKLILLSTHLGLGSQEEQQFRLQNDEKWAARFESEDISKVLGDWDQQEVFNGDLKAPNEDRRDLNPGALAQALRNLSLARQPVAQRSELTGHLDKIHFLVGERDLRYLNHYRQWQSEGLIDKFSTIPYKGHRLLSPPTKDLASQLVDILKL